MLTSESGIKAALEVAATVDHAFVGIGTIGVRSSVTIVEDMRLNDAELAAFLAQGKPAGDISPVLRRQRRRTRRAPPLERIIGVTLDDLRSVPQVGLAAGEGPRRAGRVAHRRGERSGGRSTPWPRRCCNAARRVDPVGLRGADRRPILPLCFLRGHCLLPAARRPYGASLRSHRSTHHDRAPLAGRP